MKKSTLISIIVVSVFTISAISAWVPKPLSTTKFKGHTGSVARTIIIGKSIRQGSGYVQRRNTGGGSSYGK